MWPTVKYIILSRGVKQKNTVIWIFLWATTVFIIFIKIKMLMNAEE